MLEDRCSGMLNLDRWTLEGRLAVNDGRDGGSGRFNWQKDGNETRMEFHGALGRGAWRLEADSNGAVLELADGETSRAPSVGQLVKRQLGWEIPVDALAWWVRGCAAPGEKERHFVDDLGRLMELSQLGWKIEYGKYTEIEGVFVPLKLRAQQDVYVVKLAIHDWSLKTGAGRDE